MGKGYWKMEATLKIAKETVLAKDEEIFALKAHARRREESFDEERLSFSEESAAKDEKIASQQNDLAALSNDYMRIKRRGVQDSQMLKVSDEQLGICEARLAEVSHLGELERLDAEAFSGLEHLAGLEVGLLEDEIGLLEAHEADHLEEMTAVRADCEEDISAIGFLADLAEEDHLVELDEAERVNKDIRDENEILVSQLTAVEFLAAEEVKEVEQASEALLAAAEHMAQLEQEDVLNEQQEGFEGLLQATNQLAQWETDLLTLATGRAERLLGELELARVNTLRLTEELVESNQIKAELQLQEVVREDRKKLLTAEACRNAGLRKRRRDDDDDHRGGDRQRRRHADRDHQDANQELRLRLRDRQAEGYYA